METINFKIPKFINFEISEIKGGNMKKLIIALCLFCLLLMGCGSKVLNCTIGTITDIYITPLFENCIIILDKGASYKVNFDHIKAEITIGTRVTICERQNANSYKWYEVYPIGQIKEKKK
jgi:hypothetical protein